MNFFSFFSSLSHTIVTRIMYKPRDDELRRIDEFIIRIRKRQKLSLLFLRVIYMQQRTEFEKDMRRTPTSPSPRFSRTFDMLLSRVRKINTTLKYQNFSCHILVSRSNTNINTITSKFCCFFDNLAFFNHLVHSLLLFSSFLCSFEEKKFYLSRMEEEEKKREYFISQSYMHVFSFLFT